MSKPWDNEPTPICNRAMKEHHEAEGISAVEPYTARSLEKRLRAAEEWLEATLDFIPKDNQGMLACIQAHLDAARQEDGE